MLSRGLIRCWQDICSEHLVGPGKNNGRNIQIRETANNGLAFSNLICRIRLKLLKSSQSRTIIIAGANTIGLINNNRATTGAAL
ncbi:MAG: hypothetical protein JW806_00395 [Sedimentisphaerales bacterium]|nr:hypothetical protein [Sedimentisphaerales bacterium]